MSSSDEFGRLKQDYVLLAYLRDGRFAAVAAALAVLADGGFVEAGHAGTVRRAERAVAPPEGFERKVWSAIHGAVPPGAIAARPGVDAVLNVLRHRARRLGLVRAGVPSRRFLPARTHSGRRLLATALAMCPWPPSPENGENDSASQRIGLPVALLGSVALLRLMPDFAAAGGLLDRSSDEHSAADASAPDFWKYGASGL